MDGSTLVSACNAQGFTYQAYGKDRRVLRDRVEADDALTSDERERLALYAEHDDVMDRFDRAIFDSMAKRLLKAYRRNKDWRCLDRAGYWALTRMARRESARQGVDTAMQDEFKKLLAELAPKGVSD